MMTIELVSTSGSRLLNIMICCTPTIMAHSSTSLASTSESRLTDNMIATDVLASTSKSRLTDNKTYSTLTYMACSRTATGVLASTSESTSPPST